VFDEATWRVIGINGFCSWTNDGAIYRDLNLKDFPANNPPIISVKHEGVVSDPNNGSDVAWENVRYGFYIRAQVYVPDHD
jgi:hypothetical protein